MEEGKYYIVKDKKLWEVEMLGVYNSKLENIQIMYGKFEILSEEDEEIDIQSIEEIKFISGDDENDYDNANKINELIKAVKKLDNLHRPINTNKLDKEKE